MVSQTTHPLLGLKAQRGHSLALARSSHDATLSAGRFFQRGRNAYAQPNRRRTNFQIDSGVHSAPGRFRPVFDVAGLVPFMATGLYLLITYYFLIPEPAGRGI